MVEWGNARSKLEKGRRSEESKASKHGDWSIRKKGGQRGKEKGKEKERKEATDGIRQSREALDIHESYSTGLLRTAQISPEKWMKVGEVGESGCRDHWTRTREREVRQRKKSKGGEAQEVNKSRSEAVKRSREQRKEGHGAAVGR